MDNWADRWDDLQTEGQALDRCLKRGVQTSQQFGELAAQREVEHVVARGWVFVEEPLTVVVGVKVGCAVVDQLRPADAGRVFYCETDVGGKNFTVGDTERNRNAKDVLQVVPALGVVQRLFRGLERGQLGIVI